MTTPTPILTQIAELTAEANRLEQSDSGWRLARAAYAEIERLKAQLLAEQGKYLSAPCNAHVEAYRAELELVRRRVQVLAASPRLREALSDIYGGRLNCSLAPRNRITVH